MSDQTVNQYTYQWEYVEWATKVTKPFSFNSLRILAISSAFSLILAQKQYQYLQESLQFADLKFMFNKNNNNNIIFLDINTNITSFDITIHVYYYNLDRGSWRGKMGAGICLF